jgi:hypothetical protein
MIQGTITIIHNEGIIVEHQVKEVVGALIDAKVSFVIEAYRDDGGAEILIHGGMDRILEVCESTQEV